MLLTSLKRTSIFNLCFDIKLANTTLERSKRGLWAYTFNKSNHHFEETNYYASLKIIKVLSCHINCFKKLLLTTLH